MNLNYSTSIAGTFFPNPIFTASGCAGSGKELSHFFPLTELGAVCLLYTSDAADE